MSAPRVKICGITSIEDAKSALIAGADAIGLVFYEASPRYVELEQAREIARAVGPFVTVVGLFVDAPESEVTRVLAEVDLQLLQFHGSETEAYCRQFQRPYMKALRMKPDLDVEAGMAEYPSASAILLDAYRKGVPGGTGEVFDWQRVPQNCKQNIVLAGGLNPDNVARAVASTSNIYALDVSGGVESEPGRKDSEKISMFVNRAKSGEVE